MKFLKPLGLAIVFCVTAAVAGDPAFAHAKLLSEVPAAQGTSNGQPTTEPITELRLNFSESLNRTFSKVSVTDASGGTVALSRVALDEKDDKILVATFATPLQAGEYTVSWTAVAADGHKTTGTYKIDVPK